MTSGCHLYVAIFDSQITHYIDDSRMATHVLVTREIAESHTGENIADNLKDVIPIDVFLNTDNATKIVLSA